MASLALFNEGVPAHFFHLIEAPTMRLPNIKMLLCWPLECIFMASLKIAHFWSNLIGGGTSAFFYMVVTKMAPHRNVLEPLNGKRQSEVKERKDGDLATGARDRMENVLEYIINITMEINFSSKVYSKSLLKESHLSCT